MTKLPKILLNSVQQTLSDANDSSPIRSCQPVEGGCISKAARIVTDNRAYFLKWDSRPIPWFFPTEASGLAQIRATKTVRTPEVIGTGSQEDGGPGYILQEWVGPEPGGPRIFPSARLGEQLAAMHRAPVEQSPRYGFRVNNYLGSSGQMGGFDADWIRFFRERRLKPQIEMAIEDDYISPRLLAGLETVLGNLDRWLSGVPRQPCLVHGDLWTGNVLHSTDEEPVLIDPAIYYADREVDLAYTRLFGGFPEEFYEAYESVWPLEPGWEDREDLYNLYHLLNHLNIFGTEYLAQVEAVVMRYGDSR